MLAVAMALLQIAPAAPIRIQPTPANMAVSCQLMLSDEQLDPDSPRSPLRCAELVLGMIVHIEGKRGRASDFCLPTDASTAAKPGAVMAAAYVDFYQQHAAAVAAVGPTKATARSVMMIAMTRRFPCA